MSLKGTQTEKNLACAFAGESMARNRYTFFAEVAKKQGYEQIAQLFIETAENEKVHANYFWSQIKGLGSVKIETEVPACGVNDTLTNLRNAAAGEYAEHTTDYPHFADVAEKEGFAKIAKAFRGIAAVEKEHEIRFNTLAKQVESSTVFKREAVVAWKCRNCGYVVRAKVAPKACPVCFKPQGWFEIKEVLE
ncbi:rubrerythrin, putative [Trichomonas vaginalis G3]|uniref:Rubrerythrin, putative n=1 Tax=Trichomonas vaginalis (strain ATCC PRA-98 / G3) TaxID=412133 RepID=A2EHC4_TRIV3|nr:rubrerythrin family [Trichomonas vaginalis G3]EAY07902.1 rubrerythrin, putative [Trichomonas vaginalis G3]KAI5531214.1 rubrerythrin family [Trichomonas vaginalis G3]|eukprot:XP_001320125.1 rubrerythrin [Trichomonas vaginalis G3]